MKETQGSVEVTSYGQMNNINRYGSYTIGSGRKNIHTSRSQVIRLTLSGSEKRLPKVNYSLDDLSDLESKLVLITGRESSEVKDVELFLQVREFFHERNALECRNRIMKNSLFFSRV